MRHLATCLALSAALLAAGCGEKSEPAASAAGGSGGGSGEKRTLTGCVELWNGPHVGSTRLQNVAKSQAIHAKVQVKRGRCVVQFASRDGKVYGRYVEGENVTGPWTLDAQLAPFDVARRVFNTANARGNADGTLSPGT